MPSPQKAVPSKALQTPGSSRQQGGFRPGAGRKPLDPRLKKVQVGLKLPQWMSDDLVALSRKTGLPVSGLIDRAIAVAYKFKSPQGLK